MNAMKNGLDGYLATRNLDFSYLGGETGKLSQWQDVGAVVGSLEEAYRLLPFREADGRLFS